MSSLVLDSEGLNRALEGRPATRDALLDACTGGRAELAAAASELRARFKPGYATFSKKAFLDVVNLCRDECSYCTYKSEPGGPGASMMTTGQVRQLLGLAARYRCVEALLVTGERPEERYPEARAWLRREGFASTAEYLVHASEMALDAGLFPHTNAGNLEPGELRELAGTNCSMGLMLESSSDRLAGPGMPHRLAASKRPAARLRVLEDAGRLGIPMTTGILVGIGENAEELVDSLLAIRDVHRRFGNIQEVIVQNFRPKPGTGMAASPPADAGRLETAVALARVAMPDANIQVPPNLSPGSYQRFLRLGINDWGGISPLTPDHVNPEFPWPGIGEVERRTREAGMTLECRFPAYPEFLGMVPGRLRERMRAADDGRGLVREGRWR